MERESQKKKALLQVATPPVRQKENKKPNRRTLENIRSRNKTAPRNKKSDVRSRRQTDKKALWIRT
jgi:hypothetical protein